MSQLSFQLRSSIAALGVAMLAQAEVAEAAPSRSKRFARVETATLTVAPKARTASPAAVAPMPEAPPVAVVSLGAQTISLYSGTTLIAQSPISSGRDGYRTPTGVFSILQKKRYHESNIYSGAPMPFMQRLTWSGIALHAGNLPGYRASHGCVRLPHDFSQRLFSMTRMGGRVVVTSDVASPQAIAHSSLPTPVMTPDPVMASASLAPGSALTFASATPAAGSDTVTRLLNPIQAAELEKRRLAAAQVDATRKSAEALEAAAIAARASDAARLERVGIQRQITGFVDMAAKARARLATANSDEDRTQAEASLFAAEEAIEDATAALADARKAEALVYDASFQAARSARDLEDAADEIEQVAKLASRGTEPITVFISRKEGKVLVRQSGQVILEGGVTFRDAHTPLGTHVFTANSVNDTNTLQWAGVSISDGAVGRQSPSLALDRITIDPIAASAIGKRLWVGATLIISDQGVSNETGKGTDFIVLTK